MSKQHGALKWFYQGIHLGASHYAQLVMYELFFGLLVLLLAVTVVGVVLIPGVMMAQIRVSLAIAREEDFKLLECLFDGYRDGLWWKAVVAMLIISIGVSAGTLLLVIPGLYIMSIWFFVLYLMIDYKLSPLECLSKSSEWAKNLGIMNIIKFILLVMSISIVVMMPFVLLPNSMLAINILNIILAPFSVMLPISVYLTASKAE